MWALLVLGVKVPHVLLGDIEGPQGPLGNSTHSALTVTRARRFGRPSTCLCYASGLCLTIFIKGGRTLHSIPMEKWPCKR